MLRIVKELELLINFFAVNFRYNYLIDKIEISIYYLNQLITIPNGTDQGGIAF